MRLRSLMLVRHGESAGNLARARAIREGAETFGLGVRDADVPLTGLGRAQAVAAGHRLAALPPDQRPEVAVVSPFLRARDTAELALKALPEPPRARVDERLRDRDMGALFGLSPLGVRARHPEEPARKERDGKFYYRPPGGEAWTDIALRLRSLFADLDRDHAGRRVVLFAHDAVIVVARYVLEGLSEDDIMEIERVPVANASLTWWDSNGGEPRLVAYNEVGHLAGLSR